MDRISCVFGGLDTPIREGDHILTKHAAIGILKKKKMNKMLNQIISYLRFTLLKARVSLSILHTVLVTIGLRGQIFHRVGCALGSCGASRHERDEEEDLIK